MTGLLPNSTIQHVQTTSIPPSSLPLTCSCSKTLSSSLDMMNFEQIVKQNEKERESEREKFKLERKRERQKDLEQFELMFNSSLTPRTRN